MKKSYPAIDFHQFGGDTDDDRLILFAANAKDIARWAGIPRKGWRIRMLFQRWIKPNRENELRDFWTRASVSKPDKKQQYIVGPTAIVVAMRDVPEFKDGEIVLNYDSPIAGLETDAEKLAALAKRILPQLTERLTDDERQQLDEFNEHPLAPLPDIGHNYVLEFAMQATQMAADADWFMENNSLGETQETVELIASMESLVKPGVVVDGQHRLWGAQSIPNDVVLPVVVMVRADWVEQIYQFVVINEKAQKVDSELLNDIFASSLTPREQTAMRTQFKRVKVDIEQRIAGVLAGRDEESPFHRMVTLNLPDPPPSEADAYISQTIIQCLIEGGRGARGWRNDDEFYQRYVQPTFPVRQDWDEWKDGAWRGYWFAFWNAVREHFTPEAKKVKGNDYEIWNTREQTNLTKGVGLKLFQAFFMESTIELIDDEVPKLEVLKKYLPDEDAEREYSEAITKNAISESPAAFKQHVKEFFLAKFPVRFFTGNWEPSLDDTSGHEKVLFQMREALKRDNWRASGGGVFRAGDD